MFKIGGGERAAEELAVPFLGRIPIDPIVVEKCDAGNPLMAEATESAAKKALMEVAAKILEAVGLSEETATDRVV